MKKIFTKFFLLLKRDDARSIQLDFLRGVAILLILFRHSAFAYHKKWLLQPVFNVMFRFGWTGVDLFFVLSGFLVGGLLFHELRSRSTLDSRRFIIRRGFKIWPAYFFFLLFLWVAHYNAVPSWGIKTTTLKLLPNFLHIQNYLGSIRPHTWSLAVEEHFYILLPLFLYIVLRKRSPNSTSLPEIPVLAGILIVFCTLMRFLTVKDLSGDFRLVLFPTHLRIDGLFFGVLLAYLFHFKKNLLAPAQKHRILTLMLGLALISPMIKLEVTTVKFVQTIGLTMLYTGYGLVLLSFVFMPLDKGISGAFFRSYSARIVAFIGFHSYSIYLWHWDLGYVMVARVIPSRLALQIPSSLAWVINTSAMIVFAVLGGAIMGVLIEKPFIKLRDRIYPSRASALAEKAG